MSNNVELARFKDAGASVKLRAGMELAPHAAAKASIYTNQTERHSSSLWEPAT